MSNSKVHLSIDRLPCLDRFANADGGALRVDHSPHNAFLAGFVLDADVYVPGPEEAGDLAAPNGHSFNLLEKYALVSGRSKSKAVQHEETSVRQSVAGSRDAVGGEANHEQPGERQ